MPLRIRPPVGAPPSVPGHQAAMLGQDVAECRLFAGPSHERAHRVKRSSHPLVLLPLVGFGPRAASIPEIGAPGRSA